MICQGVLCFLTGREADWSAIPGQASSVPLPFGPCGGKSPLPKSEVLILDFPLVMAVANRPAKLNVGKCWEPGAVVICKPGFRLFSDGALCSP